MAENSDTEKKSGRLSRYVCASQVSFTGPPSIDSFKHKRRTAYISRWPPFTFEEGGGDRSIVGKHYSPSLGGPRHSLICDAPVFDTTSPGLGEWLKQRLALAASRESHPSQDLCELPPLLVAVAGRACLMADGSWRDKPPQLVLGWRKVRSPS